MGVGGGIAAQLVEGGDALDVATGIEEGDVESEEGDGEGEGTEPVDAVIVLRGGEIGEGVPSSDDADEAEGDIEVELPLPSEIADKEGAVEGAPDPAGGVDGTEGAEGGGATLGRIDVGDDGHTDGDHGAAAEGTDDAAKDEAGQTGGERDPDGADEKEGEGTDVDSAAANEVTEAADEGHDDDIGDEIGVDNPSGIIETFGEGDVEVEDHLAEHGTDDGEVVGGDEDAEGEGEEDKAG